jgi:nicotinate-nucleotide adenylyltransferase
MKIALFGGTFNPVHNGHLLIAEAARETYRLDRVLFVPAGLPPHKRPPRTSAKHRLAMLRLAIRGNPAFDISDWEIRRKRVVYTYETLEHFRRTRPRASLFFLVGSDALKNLPRWREAKRLRSLCRFISMKRILPYASHEVRRRVRKRLSIRYQVPESVERYIRERQLYRQPE